MNKSKGKNPVLFSLMEVPILTSCSILASWFFLFFFFFVTIVINPSISARTPLGSRHHSRHRPITFYMAEYNLNRTQAPSVTKAHGQLPFSKPLGLFPPSGGIFVPQPNSRPSQILDLPGIVGLSYPARAAAVQELEFGTVTPIDEDLFDGLDSGSKVVVGKAQGMYVDCSEEGRRRSHMMAMTVTFLSSSGNAIEDGLRLFGVHQQADVEFHIAVIGGTGKYHDANGYATVIKAVNNNNNNFDSSTEWEETSGAGGGARELLLFKIYLG